jgi:acetyl-CoA carboxylase/biotin carboxylase 1
MLAGTNSADGSFVSGFLDKDSFKEYMGGWGKSVIAGRGRLGGINVGVIAVETRLVEQRIPADPGNSESREDVKPQAGQVWYPDSAYKTAQAIEDFNRGENLPLIIFANWRGFSGGTRDMYGEILKFGSMIVDALRTYKHPVFVYIPPNGELRGGAWVVLDPTINPAKMEMYADTEARGGILEPPGICEVKYRKPDQVAAAHRMDPVLKELDDDLAHCSDPAQNKRIASDIADRENMLAPVYLNVAHEFADLHDRAGRMKAKGCIKEELQWKSSRSFFYWRIRRRISEDAFKDRLIEASGGKMTLSEANEKVSATLGSDMDDQAAAAWYDSNANAMDAAEKAVRLESAAGAVSKLLAGLSEEDKKIVLGKAATMDINGKLGYPGFAMGA